MVGFAIEKKLIIMFGPVPSSIEFHVIVNAVSNTGICAVWCASVGVLLRSFVKIPRYGS